MNWEVERHDWSRIGRHLAGMSEVIRSLVAVTEPAEAERLYWHVDSVVVQNGALLPGATEVTACLVQCLLSAVSEGRIQILELLVQLGGGVADESTAVPRSF